jgi:gluconate 2-dehydrogenase gamma chain
VNLPDSNISRRNLLLGSLMASTGLMMPEAFARTIRAGIPWTAGQADTPHGLEDVRFFTDAERRCIDAITSRLIPTDETGPGAREADVVTFIDRQLAGFYGRGQRWYMQGPFEEGTDQQGYQSELPPAPLYRAAITALDDNSRTEFDGASFAELSEADQDAVLTAMEEGSIEFDGVSAATFFSLVHDNAIEGFFSDPIYGGNRDMVGWRLVGFPGARYDYRDYLGHDGAAIEIEPVGLSGRPAWNPG